MSATKVEEYVREWLTTLVATDGILITISLMVLTILYTSPAFEVWQSMLVGSVVLIASILLMLSAFNALDAHGTLVLVLKTSDEKKKKELDQTMRNRANNADVYFKRSLVLLIISLILIILLPIITEWISLVN